MTHHGRWVIDHPGIYTIVCDCDWSFSDGNRHVAGNPAEVAARHRGHRREMDQRAEVGA